MKRTLAFISILCIVALGFAATGLAPSAGRSIPGQAKGKPAVAPAVDLKILPPVVLEAFKKAYPKAVIRSVSKETEKGVTYYEVESVDGELARDLLYTADGKAVEIEEAVPPSDLPPAVVQALEKAHPGAKILKAESIFKEGRRSFELEIQVKEKKMAVTMDPSGKIIE